MADLSLINQLKDEIAAMEKGKGSNPSPKGPLKTDSCSDAFGKIVALMNVSDRSEKTLRERLARAGYPECEVDEALERAKRCGIVDDLRYADVLIRSRISQGKGSVGIERELRDQGIDPDCVSGWPDDFTVDDESERQRALSFLEAHPSRSKNKREGAYRKLLQKGYSSSIAASVARAWADSF